VEASSEKNRRINELSVNKKGRVNSEKKMRIEFEQHVEYYQRLMIEVARKTFPETEINIDV